MLNPVEGNASEGWYWRADDDSSTLVGILNTDTQEARVAVWLDYHSNGVQSRYHLPEITIPPRGAELIHIGEIVAAGQPDADGEVIPAGVSYGGYRVQKVGGRLNKTIITEALVVNRRTKSYLTFYNTCCGFSFVTFSPFSIEGLVGETEQLSITGLDSCTGAAVPLTSSGSYSSDNNSVATVSGGGLVSCVGAGSTSVTSSINYFQAPFMCEGGGGGLVPTLGDCDCLSVNESNTIPVEVRDLASFRITVVSQPVTGETNSVVSGQSAQVKVEALDNAGAIFTGYRGTVSFSSSDTLATLPGNYTFTASDAGVHIFNVTLKTVAGNSARRDLKVRDVNKNVSTTRNIFVWFRVVATREGLLPNPTACGHTIVPNDRFVALPATNLCNVGVRLANGALKVNTTVLDVGPWCPNTPLPGGFNQCDCASDRYWQTTGVPCVESKTCDTNNAGIDLADGTWADLGMTNNGFIFWRFQ